MVINRRQFLVITIIAALIICFSPNNLSYGKSLKKQKKELKQVQKQKDDISEEFEVIKVKISKKEKELASVKSSITLKKKQIRKSEKELAITKKDISERKEGLNQRLSTMYKNGSIGYLDVILGSNNVEELVTNVDLVQNIFRNDQKILTELKSQKKILEESEAKLKAERSSLVVVKERGEKVKSELGENKNQLKAKLDELEKQEEELKANIADAIASGGVTYEGGKWAFPLKRGYVITGHFGERRSYERHPGVDLAVPTGTPIYAAQGGKVITAGWYGGYGNAVVIYHGNGLTSVYGHNSSVKVSPGQVVKKGQLISLAGSTGWSTGPHLHFEVRNSAGSPISPAPYIGVQ